MLEIPYNGKIGKDLNLEEFIDAVEKPEIIDIFDGVLKERTKRVVYTSFNGDFLDYINHMVYVALKLGYTPINPECALGYYLSTSSHNNSKIETMLDCISLELLCDEIWLFLENASDAKLYPEGVAAEIMAWISNKPDANMNLRIFGDELVKSFNTIATIGNQAVPIYNFYNDFPQYEEVNISNIIKSFDERYSYEIQTKLIDKLNANQRKCVYVSTDFYDIKYSDWARKYLYEKNMVGIIPSQLLNSFVLNFAYKDQVIESYLADRRALLSKIDTIYFIQKPGAGSRFSIDFLFDVYYWLKNKDKYSANFYDWSEFNVPKFSDRWALTTKEHCEVWNS